jgi:excinuclease UvrABC nuclease subunit
MGEKRVQKLLSEYKSIKKISELKPEQIQNALGFPDLIAQSIIELAKDSVSS